MGWFEDKNKEKVASLPKEYQEIYKNFIMPVDTNINLDDVILSDENREKYDLLIREFEHREEFRKYGLEPVNRVLLYGASGTGKTFSTKAFCNKIGFTMLYIDIAKALTEDTVAQNVSAIFELAKYMGHCLIMLDECDAIAWQRDTGNSDTGVIRRATNSIFQSLDNVLGDNMFFAATNMLHRLDNAFERRFNIKMEFRRPNIDLKEAMQHFLRPEFKFVDDVDNTTDTIVKNRALESKKLSYYEIEVLVQRAMKSAIVRKDMTVRTSELYLELSKEMNLKLRFKTDADDEAIFHSSGDNYNR